MDQLETIIEMRKTLTAMNERLNSCSKKEDYQRYYDSLLHYQRVINKYLNKANEELNTAIEKAYRIKNEI